MNIIIDTDSLINCDDLAARRRSELHWHPPHTVRFPLTEACEALRSKRNALTRRCAYNRWAERGGQPGGELEDWLSAEQEVDRLLERRDRMIREAAYFRWEGRRCAPGNALDDWLEAEREIDTGLGFQGP